MSEASVRDSWHDERLAEAIRAAHANYVSKAGEMHEAKEYRRKLVKAARGTLTLQGVADVLGMTRKDIDAIVNGRD